MVVVLLICMHIRMYSLLTCFSLGGASVPLRALVSVSCYIIIWTNRVSNTFHMSTDQVTCVCHIRECCTIGTLNYSQFLIENVIYV